MSATAYRLKALLLIIASAPSACGPAATPTPPAIPITVQLSWTHQAQFAGLHAADQRRFYADEGLAVAFIEGGPSIAPAEIVLGGTAQSGVTSGESLLYVRADGLPARAIATTYRQSPRVYIALADSGITKPQDFVGKTISGGRGGRALLYAMLGRLGISPDQHTLVESTPDLIAEAPDLVLRFVLATLKGWTCAVELPDEAGAVVLHYSPQAEVEHEEAVMVASIPLVNTGEAHIGWVKPDIWAGMENTLREQGVITQPLDVPRVYALQFLQEMLEGK